MIVTVRFPKTNCGISKERPAMTTHINQASSISSSNFSENRVAFDMIYDLIPGRNTTHSHINDVYISSYQLAIRFASQHPDIFRDLGLPIGGLGVGENRSLAQLIGKILSHESSQQHPRVIGGYLSGLYVSNITFKSDDGSDVISSVSDLTIWRRNTAE